MWGNIKCAEIDLGKLRNNMNSIKKYLDEKVNIGAVIKADAYGHGAANLLEELMKEKRIQMLIVGTIEEAIEMFHIGCAVPILILGNILGHESERIYNYNFIYSAYNMDSLYQIASFGQNNKRKIRVHIRIDILNIGMGFSIEEFHKYKKEIFEMDQIVVEGIYSHLYSSYSFQNDLIVSELEQFSNVIKSFSEEVRKKLIVHVASSALIFEYPEYHFDMVRVGTALYGLSCNPQETYGLQPILSLKAKIVSIKAVRENQPVSYNTKVRENLLGFQSGETKSDSILQVAHISFGYWDCPLLLTKKNIKVWINGNLYPLKDEACMDNACIDITGSSGIQVGDEVIILGDKPGITLSAVLNRLKIDLVHSEWVCMISKRLPRTYLN